MQINLCFPEKITAAEAETLASQLQSPALVTDGRHIIRYRNKAAYRLPFLRNGAKLDRFISAACAESLKNAPSGTFVVGGAEDCRLPDIAALVCCGCTIVVLDALSAKNGDADTAAVLAESAEKAREAFFDAMADDFNTALAISHSRPCSFIISLVTYTPPWPFASAVIQPKSMSDAKKRSGT